MAKEKGLGTIEIKPENKGKFTDYCDSLGFNGVTQECIDKAKKSKNPKTRKRATFAENARGWSKKKSKKKKTK